MRRVSKDEIRHIGKSKLYEIFVRAVAIMDDSEFKRTDSEEQVKFRFVYAHEKDENDEIVCYTFIVMLIDNKRMEIRSIDYIEAYGGDNLVAVFEKNEKFNTWGGIRPIEVSSEEGALVSQIFDDVFKRLHRELEP